MPNELIKYTSEGVIIAEYYQIREMLVNKMKEIYGSDIDLSTGTADGIFIENLSLMINNILDGVKKLYASLDINSANGKALEMLCNLSNVSRKPATPSTTSLVVTLDNSEPSNLTTRELSFLDKSGNIWKFKSLNQDVTFEKGQAKNIDVTCEELGPIKAPQHWIYTTVDTQYLMTVDQPFEARVGTYEETDSHLRARRNQSLGSSGTTVLESLAGALLNLDAIDDVKIYTNTSGADITTLDGTVVHNHDVYIILRYKPNISIDDSTIGTIIYEKMTPGIKTTEWLEGNESGYNHSFIYNQYILGQPVTSGVDQVVYWKATEPESPIIKIKITALDYFASENNYTSNLIANNVIDYLNNLPLSSTLNSHDIYDVVKYSDPLFRGRSTFDIGEITLPTDPASPDTYFYYRNITINNLQNNEYEIVLF